MSGIKTLCTQPGTLLDSRGLIADCGDYAAVYCVKSTGASWVVKRSKTGEGFAVLMRLDYTPSAFAAAHNRLWIAKQDAILEHVVGEDDLWHEHRVSGCVVYMQASPTSG
ncbi:hypothetical protein HaLaN_07092 [Haematococcus lacustris]|uniref:Uncharacterized protein n=1 Tax=Haematococcus lacustris TaxID=44745 RepID=A0A699YN82_HAELA|nr:hypothetical protein HaLaN_07092 [Haematococcus lacustris]